MKKLGLLLFSWSLIFCVKPVMAQKSDKVLKVLSYNSMHGFTTDSTSKIKYLDWVKQLSPDVILYQELIGYTIADLQQFASQYGHQYFDIISREGGYDVTHPLAITSRFPLNEVKKVNDGMWHSLLHAKIKGIHFIVTHLAPFTVEDRRQDVEVILSTINSLPKGAPVMVAGDFNSFAKFDSTNYSEELLKSMSRLEGRLEPKSGTPIVKNRTIYRNNLDNGKLDYTVTDKMAAAGFVDAYHHLYKSFKHSVPVKSNITKKSFLRRIDYMWVNPVLAKSLTEADIIQDEVTDVISDHYPLWAKFRVK